MALLDLTKAFGSVPNYGPINIPFRTGLAASSFGEAVPAFDNGVSETADLATKVRRFQFQPKKTVFDPKTGKAITEEMNVEVTPSASAAITTPKVTSSATTGSFVNPNALNYRGASIDFSTDTPTAQVAPTATPTVDAPAATEDSNGMGLFQQSNLTQGVLSGIGVIGDIAGIAATKNMRPALAHYQDYTTPIKPNLVADRSMEIKAAGEEQIDTAVNTARNDAARQGIAFMGAPMAAKRMSATNELGSGIAQYRAGVDTQNAGILNQTAQYNDTADRNQRQFNSQTSAQNAQIQNQFDMYKSSLIGQGMANIDKRLSNFGQTMVDNRAYDIAKDEAGLLSKIDSASAEIEANPNSYAANQARKNIAEYQAQLDALRKTQYR